MSVYRENREANGILSIALSEFLSRRVGDNPVPKSTMDTLELAEQAMRNAADALHRAERTC